tara:strand:- start:351 stop:1031 length:681 start_codon:yes stop_codon:yes gene_type:complete
MNNPHTQDDDPQNPFTDIHFQFFSSVEYTPADYDDPDDDEIIEGDVIASFGKSILLTGGKSLFEVLELHVPDYADPNDLDNLLLTNGANIKHFKSVEKDFYSLELSHNLINFARMYGVYELGFNKSIWGTGHLLLNTNAFKHFYELLGVERPLPLSLDDEIEFLKHTNDERVSHDYVHAQLELLQTESFYKFAIAFTADQLVNTMVENYTQLEHLIDEKRVGREND